MNNADPREALIQKGNELLDIMYEVSQLERKHEDIIKAVKNSDGMSRDEKASLIFDKDFISVITERLELHSRYEKTLAAYSLLRSTIEALDVPRPTLADFDS